MLGSTTPILLFAAFEILEVRLAEHLTQPTPLPDHEALPSSLTSPLVHIQDREQPEATPAPPELSRPIQITVRTVLVAACAALAALFPQLVLVVSVTGAVGDSLLGLVLPGVMALVSPQTCKEYQGIALGTTVLGVVTMLCGVAVPFFPVD